LSRVDLHAHTTASDGVRSPTALVDYAFGRGLAVLAITDHDTVNGLDAALSHAASNLEVWPGVEISTDVPGTEIHILGYLLDHHDLRLAESLARLRAGRVDRAKGMVEKLGALGLPIEWRRVQELAGVGTVGRPHIAQALLDAGHIATFKEAFDRYIGRNGPAYVERYKLTPAEAIGLILEAGGLPVLAHPLYIGAAAETGKQFDLGGLLPELVRAGLGGIETYYPAYTPEINAQLRALADQFGLIPTGGTDYHGGNITSTELGEVDVPWSTVERIRAWKSAAG
jgi:3',5'-nucleoside bisphosphate phosphatase